MLTIRRLAGLILLTGFVSTVVSCPMGRYKYYSYPAAEEATDFGVVRARIMGTYKKVSQDETVLASPYRLVVAVVMPIELIDTRQPCRLHINEITMTALDTSSIVFSIRDFSGPFEQATKKKYSSGFDRELPEIPYADYDIGVELSIVGCKSEVSSRKFSFVIKKDYSEGEKTLWDSLRNL